MQLTAVVVSLVLAAAVSAKGNGGNSIKSQCSQMEKLAKQSELAANETKLANKFDNNQTAIDAFKAKVADKATQLTTMMSNTTLMDACAPIQAHAADVSQCKVIQRMEKMIATAANQTKLDSKFEGNATKIDAFKAKASNAATELTAMQSNGTLTSFCSVQADVQSCKSIQKMQKTIAMSTDQAALDAEFKGNATKIEKFQAKVPKIQAKLDALKGNATLVNTCNSLSQAQKDGTNNAAAAAASGQTGSAGRIEITSSAISAAVIVLTAGMIML